MGERIKPILEQLRLAQQQAGPSAVYDQTGQDDEDAFRKRFRKVKEDAEGVAGVLVQERMKTEFPDDPQQEEIVAWPAMTAKRDAGSAANAITSADRDHHQMGFGVADELNQGQGVTIAVLATGCRRMHQMTEQVATEPIDCTGIGGGMIDPHGWGTAICSMLVSQPSPTQPSGTARRARVVPIQVAHAAQGYATEAWLAMGVVAARQLKADIILIPYCSPEPMPSVEEAIREALLAGCLVVVAAGDVRDGYQGMYYPAGYVEAVAVGAVDGVGNQPEWSAKGDQTALLASGVEQVAAGTGETVDLISGTGAAAAHVAAAAALIITRYRELHHVKPSPADVLAFLTSTSKIKSDEDEVPFLASSLIDVGAALAQIIPPAPAAEDRQEQPGDLRDPLKGATVHHIKRGRLELIDAMVKVTMWLKDDESDRLFLTKEFEPSGPTSAD